MTIQQLKKKIKIQNFKKLKYKFNNTISKDIIYFYQKK